MIVSCSVCNSVAAELFPRLRNQLLLSVKGTHRWKRISPGHLGRPKRLGDAHGIDIVSTLKLPSFLSRITMKLCGTNEAQRSLCPHERLVMPVLPEVAPPFL